MKQDKNQHELKAEWNRRSQNYKTFDKLLQDTHGGDLEDMYGWVLTKVKKQFKTQYEYDQFLTDFNNWMLNRKISISE